MLELASVFKLYGPEYLQNYGDRMLPSHKKAMEDIEFCRTEVMGGHVYYCDACDERLYAYHSCGNRHCPKACPHEDGGVAMTALMIGATSKCRNRCRSTTSWSPAHCPIASIRSPAQTRS